MPYITLKDGSQKYFKDWGTGRPVVFCHGWPVNADAWETQADLVASNGYRAVAHDRRGHGRSTQTWDGNTMDQYADDLAELLDQLELRDVTLVGHSTGGGEVTRYLGLHGTARTRDAVLVGAIPPLMLKTPANPDGSPIAVFDALREALAGDRSQFYYDLSTSFYGFNRPGATVSEGKRREFWLQSMQVGYKAAYDCIKEFSETTWRRSTSRSWSCTGKTTRSCRSRPPRRRACSCSRTEHSRSIPAPRTGCGAATKRRSTKT